MPLCEAQKQVVRIRGGTRALVTSMSREVENFNETLHDKTQEEISVLLNDWERRSTRPRTTLRQLNQRFESSEDTNEPLTAPEWETEIANREDYERKLDLIEELVANLRGKQDPSTLDPLLGKTESDSAKNDPATDTSMAQLLEQLIKVQQLSANTAALQQLPQVNVRKFGGDTVEFLQFWNEFKSTVHEKESLADVVKFRHLRQLLIGEAAAAIEAIPVTNENYRKAVDYLIRRYGDVQQITIKIFTRLLETTKSKELSIRQIIDQANNAIAMLQSLKSEPEYYSLTMYPLILKAIPRSMSLRFINSRSKQSNPNLELGNDDEGVDAAIFDGNEQALLEDIVIPEDLPQQFNSSFRALMVFLGREAQAREQQEQLCSTSKESAGKKDDSQQSLSKRNQGRRDGKPQQGVQVYATSTSRESTDKCLICKAEHFTARCKKDLPIERKKSNIEKANACTKCLRRNHLATQSNRELQCHHCKGEHYGVLCPTKVTVTVCQHGDSLLPTGHVRVLSTSGEQEMARFLMDTGSQRSFITEKLAEKLNLVPSSFEWVTIYSFGSEKQAIPQRLASVLFKIVTPQGFLEFMALVTPTITANDPPKIPKSLRESTSETFSEREDGPSHIDILLGASDVMKLLKDPFKKLGHYTILSSKVGHVVVGPQVLSPGSTATLLSVLKPRITLEDFWKLEHLGILPEDLAKDSDEYNLIEQFKASVKRSSTGQYETIINVEERKVVNMNTNQALALEQANNLMTKLQKDANLCKSYMGEMKNFIDSDFAEKLPSDEIGRYFMPHFPVINPSKTTFKVRPVFNASSHFKNEVSLNECIKNCPNLLPTAMDTLIKFRKYPIALTGDISKAYLRIGIQKEYRNFLCFYWLKNADSLNSGLEPYRMKVNTFGVKDAQFNMIMAIRTHAESFSESAPRAAHALLNDLYSDDLLSGGYSESEVVALQRTVASVLGNAGLEMKKWRSNSAHVRSALDCDATLEAKMITQCQAAEKVLGIAWSDVDDIFRFETRSLKNFISESKFTKRIFNLNDLFRHPVLILRAVLHLRTWALQWQDVLESRLRKTSEASETIPSRGPVRFRG